MDINDLTIGEARQLAAMFAGGSVPAQKHMIGKKVIVRCRDAGVHFGTLVSYEGREAFLTDSRRLWQWFAAKGHSLSGVALHGLKHSESKVAGCLPELLLTETCEIILCTPQAAKSIEGAAEYEP